MDNTRIEWCDATWNPVTGCCHGCDYCYAQRIANRFSSYGRRKVFADDHLHTRTDGAVRTVYLNLHELGEPTTSMDKKGRYEPYPSGFEPTLHKYRLEQPKEWHKPRNIFVCSMADLFGDWVPDEWIKAVFDACGDAPWHRYIFLTKNPNRYIDLAKKGMLPQEHWYGYTANRQSDLWEFDHADDCPVKHLFVSVEPILEPIELRISTHVPMDWVIIGAETGNRKGKVVPEREWIEDIMEECYYSVTPLFMKDSLIPIVGDENMRREFPWETKGADGDEA